MQWFTLLTAAFAPALFLDFNRQQTMAWPEAYSRGLRATAAVELVHLSYTGTACLPSAVHVSATAASIYRRPVDDGSQPSATAVTQTPIHSTPSSPLLTAAHTTTTTAHRSTAMHHTTPQTASPSTPLIRSLHPPNHPSITHTNTDHFTQSSLSWQPAVELDNTVVGGDLFDRQQMAL